MTKKKVLRQIKRLYLEGSLDNAIKILSGLREQYGGSATIDMDYMDSYSDDESKVHYLYFEEEESDKEYQDRLEWQKKQKAKQEAWDLVQYKRLQEKYGQ